MEVEGWMLVLRLSEMLFLLWDFMEEDKKIRAGFPVNHSTLT